MPHPGMQMPPPGMMPNGGMGMGMGMGMPPPHIIAQMQQHAAAMAMAQQQQPGMGGVPPQSLQGIMNEQARHRGQQQQQQGFGGGRGFLHSSQPRSDVVRNMSWTRMTAEEVNQILRLQNSMLRDAAATNVYSNMLAAKQGTRANFAGPRIEGRSIKLSEALEGALGKPAPRDLRRPRQLVQISRGSAADPSPPAEPTGGEGDVGAEGEGDGANLNNPKEISTLPRAVRLSVENGMVRMLNVQVGFLRAWLFPPSPLSPLVFSPSLSGVAPPPCPSFCLSRSSLTVCVSPSSLSLFSPMWSSTSSILFGTHAYPDQPFMSILLTARTPPPTPFWNKSGHRQDSVARPKHD